jgi:hypothetical protein
VSSSGCGSANGSGGLRQGKSAGSLQQQSQTPAADADQQSMWQRWFGSSGGSSSAKEEEQLLLPVPMRAR